MSDAALQLRCQSEAEGAWVSKGL